MPRTTNTQHNDTEELVDIGTVQIDIDLPVEERVKSYAEQMKNPYRFLIGGLIVNIEHLDNGLSLERALSSYLDELN